ncbi:MAG: HNH endonuclease, partial [Anaerolineales bacterium]
MLDHIRCAAYELPFQAGERFGNLPAETLIEFLDFLAQSGELHVSRGKYFWTGGDYPPKNVSLRNASAQRVLLQSQVEGRPITIGEVDGESAPWMVHPGAIYLHEAETYLVDALDLAKGVAALHPINTDYYTEPRSETEVTLVEKQSEAKVRGGTKTCGEIRVTTQVTGYRKIQWFTHQRLATEALEMPPTRLQTTGYWLTLSDKTVEGLRQDGLWGSDPNRYGPSWPRQRDAARARDGCRCQSCGSPEKGRAHDVHHKIPFRSSASSEQANRLHNLITLCPPCHRRAETVVRVRSGLSGLSFVLGHLSPLFLMCDRNDIGVHSDPQSPLAEGRPAVVIYDRVPAGIGFSERVFV